jgi:hypothetical protein
MEDAGGDAVALRAAGAMGAAAAGAATAAIRVAGASITDAGAGGGATGALADGPNGWRASSAVIQRLWVAPQAQVISRW